VASCSDYRLRLVVLELLGGLDDDDQRSGACARSAKNALQVIDVPRQLLGRGDRQDDLTSHLLEVALAVCRTCLYQYITGFGRRRRLVAELSFDRAATRNLDDEGRLLGDRRGRLWRFSHPALRCARTVCSDGAARRGTAGDHRG
jgi:hypothetical protein